MTTGRTVAFLNKFTDLVIFEVQQTPAFINNVQFLEVTRRAVHPVLDVDNQGEHHRNQQGRTVFQSTQLQHHHFCVIPQGRFIRVKILAVSTVGSVLVQQHYHFIQTAADGRGLGILVVIPGVFQEIHHIINTRPVLSGKPGGPDRLQQQTFMHFIQVTVGAGHH
ncbi:hypothetical protein BvCmsSIP019_04433 [Escherichia coli]|nr:hypothetical protein BvCmsSIP019_04433 [Escherichia coli]